jgi:uncharacterized heparinase superfamily protein
LIIVNCGMPAIGRENWRPIARATAAHSTVTFNDASSARFVELATFRRMLGGSPIVGGPTRVTVSREESSGTIILRAMHDGYANRFGILHERALMLSSDGMRLEGEDIFLDSDGEARVSSEHDEFAIRFHLHPTVRATRLTDGHGVVLMTANKEVWTFGAHHDRVELEDSVYLAGSEGPRRTLQLVIRGHARNAARVQWLLQAHPGSAPNAGPSRQADEEEPRLPL